MRKSLRAWAPTARKPERLLKFQPDKLGRLVFIRANPDTDGRCVLQVLALHRKKLQHSCRYVTKGRYVPRKSTPNSTIFDPSSAH